MKIGCAALYPITRYGFPYSFDNYLKAVAEMSSAGFEHCELEINVDIDLEDYVERIDEVKAVLADNRMTISAIIGVVNGVYAGIPLLKRTPNSFCFSTSSSAALFGMPRTGMYAASKFAVKGLTEALSVELARFGSRAADVMPALTDTPILEATLDYSGGERPGVALKKTAAPEGATRLVQPEEVAELVWEAYGSDRVHWYIPVEMEAIDKARAAGVEPLRDQFKKTLLEG